MADKPSAKPNKSAGVGGSTKQGCAPSKQGCCGSTKSGKAPKK